MLYTRINSKIKWPENTPYWPYILTYLKHSCMETYQFQKRLQKFIAVLVLSFATTALWAQEKGADVNVKITKSDSTWYAQPWVWIVGGAVFILLLVAIVRGGGNKN